MDLGFLVVIPTAIVLIVAIISRREIEPLILGCILGSLLLGGFDFLNVFIYKGYDAMIDPGFTMVVIVSLGFAGLISIMNDTAGAEVFAEHSTKFIKGQKSMGLVTWFLCWALFIDDYMHAMVVTATMKKVADKFKVPHKLLAYLASATAAAMTVLIPTTVWSGFFMGIFENEYLATLNLDTYSIYTKTIPYMIFPFVSIIIALLVVIEVIPLLKSMHNYESIEQDSEESTKQYDFKPKAYNFVVPLLVVVIMSIITGGDIVVGLYISIVVACVMYMVQHLMSWEELRTSFLNGTKTILPTVIMLFFTFTLVEINGELGFTEYVVSKAEPFINASLLPAIIFFINSIICFSSGSFWGTSALITPIASALAVSSGAHIFLTLGAIISGAVFGSSACLFGDVNVLSATGAGVKPIDHTISQLPYCFAGWLVTIVFYLILGFVL